MHVVAAQTVAAAPTHSPRHRPNTQCSPATLSSSSCHFWRTVLVRRSAATRPRQASSDSAGAALMLVAGPLLPLLLPAAAPVVAAAPAPELLQGAYRSLTMLWRRRAAHKGQGMQGAHVESRVVTHSW
jgi:hypothetical protein